jgi:hypothetical protein
MKILAFSCLLCGLCVTQAFAGQVDEDSFVDKDFSASDFTQIATLTLGENTISGRLFAYAGDTSDTFSLLLPDGLRVASGIFTVIDAGGVDSFLTEPLGGTTPITGSAIYNLYGPYAGAVNIQIGASNGLLSYALQYMVEAVPTPPSSETPEPATTLPVLAILGYSGLRLRKSRSADAGHVHDLDS